MINGFNANSGSYTTQAMAGFFAQSRDAFADMKCRPTLVSRARYLDTISTIARAAQKCLTRAVVGSGIRYEQPRTSNIIDYDVDIKGVWDKVAMTAALDARHQLTLSQLETLVFKTMLVSGEAWLFRKGTGAWIVKEPDCIKTPDDFSTLGVMDTETRVITLANGSLIADGVELNADGVPVACYVCGEQGEYERVEYTDENGLKQVLHVYLQDRPDQVRGLPIMAPVITQLWACLAYADSETQMSILQTNMSLIITTNTASSLNPFGALTQRDLDAPLIPETGASAAKTTGSKDFAWIPPLGDQGLGGIINGVNYTIPGQTRHLAEGEDIKFIAPTAPHTGFVTFCDFMIRQIGASIGIPEQVLTGRFDANFSAVKGACSAFNHTVRQYRTAFIETFLRPLFSVFLAGFVSDPVIGELISLEAQWLPCDSPLTLDPTKEVDYYIKAIDAGLISRDEAAQALFGHPAVGGE